VRDRKALTRTFQTCSKHKEDCTIIMMFHYIPITIFQTYRRWGWRGVEG